MNSGLFPAFNDRRGGAMPQPQLLPRILEACAQALPGYLSHLKTPNDFETHVVPPAWGEWTHDP
jgi:hypothetical protein